MTKIEDVKVGDRVLSREVSTDRQDFRQVTHVMRKQTTELAHLRYRPTNRTKRTQSRPESGSDDDDSEGDPDAESGQPVQELIGTPEHRFWSVTRSSWVALAQLEAGEHLELDDGTQAIVVEVAVEPTVDNENIITYNLEVDDWHTYFVAPGNGGEGPDRTVLVHNRCPFGDDLRQTPSKRVAAERGAGAVDDLAVTSWGTRNVRTGKWAGGTRGGIDPVDDFVEHAISNGYEVIGREIDIRTPFGTRRADLILRHIESGRIGGIEIKSTIGEFNKFIKGQFAKDRFINMYGGKAVGAGAEAANLSQVDYMMKIMWGVD